MDFQTGVFGVHMKPALALERTNMNARLFVVAGTLLGLGTNLCAQETRRFDGDETAVAAAVVEWFAPNDTSLIRRQGTLVVSRVTNGRRVVSVARNEGLRMANAPGHEYFEFPAQAFQDVAKTTGLRIEYCDTYDPAAHALCGIAEPWEWLKFSGPAVNGDSALIQLQVSELDHGPPGTKPFLHGLMLDVFLQRNGGAPGRRGRRTRRHFIDTFFLRGGQGPSDPRQPSCDLFVTTTCRHEPRPSCYLATACIRNVLVNGRGQS